MKIRGNSDLWNVDINYYASRPTLFQYALVAAGPEGQVWDNKNGSNYTI